MQYRCMPLTATASHRLFSDREASAYLGVSRSQFRAMVAAGKVPRVVVPAEDGRPLRRMLVDLADLDRLIELWKRTA
jgi:hypothetical protein